MTTEPTKKETKGIIAGAERIAMKREIVRLLRELSTTVMVEQGEKLTRYADVLESDTEFEEYQLKLIRAAIDKPHTPVNFDEP